MVKFKDRKEAAEKLAVRLQPYAASHDAVLFAIPEGGIPIASEISQKINKPFDVFIVRNLELGTDQPVTLGIVALNEIYLLDKEMVDKYKISEQTIQKILDKEIKELKLYNEKYRHGKPPVDVINRTAILVDEGLTTSDKMLSAIEALKKQHAKEIIIAVPVISEDAYEKLHDKADKIISVLPPAPITRIGEWYENFPDFNESEAIDLLNYVSNRDKDK
jgi:putative phosphoribosyl transferase